MVSNESIASVVINTYNTYYVNEGVWNRLGVGFMRIGLNQ